MEPEDDPSTPETGSLTPAPQQNDFTPPAPPEEPEQPYRGLKWMFIGPHGLRAGWSAPLFVILLFLFASGLAIVFMAFHLITRGAHSLGPRQAFFAELMQVIALVAAAAVMALLERRNLLDYNLRGPNRVQYFFRGLVVGFAALSALVGSLAWGGWLHFGPVSLHGSRILAYGTAWGAMFLLVGCMEEGTVRCYLQYTFTRGMNFWWAAGVIGFVCAMLALRVKGNGVWGVYILAMLGLVPCLWLQLKKDPRSGFWQAAWATSTLFGALHTGNNGENWIGIFAAGFIGFVFCVSIWVTGSAWWAIGCHAAWDWAETFFYGTADSGMVARGHFFSTHPAGNVLWSGGTDGPEGSLLIIPIVLLILAWLLIIYRRQQYVMIDTRTAAEQPAD